jgi:hypothetical protein
MLYDSTAGEEPALTPDELARELRGDQQDDALLQTFEELGSEVSRVRLLRKDERDSKLANMETVSADNFSVDYVREQFGGGEYVAVAVDPSGRFIKRVTFKVDARYQGARFAEPAPPPMALGVSPDVQRLERVVERLVEALGKPAAPAVNPLGQMKELAEIVRTLMPATPPESNVSALKETVGLAKELVGMGREMVEDAEPSDQPPWDRIIEKGVVPIIEMAQRARRPAIAPVPARPALPAPVVPAAVVAETPTTVTQTTEGQPVWQLDLARYIPLILARARKHADPETTAAFVLQELNEDTVTAIAGAAEADDFVDTIFGKLPPEFRADANVEAWTREFLAAVPRLLFEEEGPEGESTDDGPPLGGTVHDGSAPVGEEKPEIDEAGE